MLVILNFLSYSFIADDTFRKVMEITAMRAQCLILVEKIFALGGSTLLLSPAFGDNSTNCPTLMHMHTHITHMHMHVHAHTQTATVHTTEVK